MTEIAKREHPFDSFEHPNLETTEWKETIGEQFIATFTNGFGASVVSNVYSYGGTEGLWELGVLDHDGALTYATPVTDDVLGYLSETDVLGYLKEIGDLNPEDQELWLKKKVLGSGLERLLVKVRHLELEANHDLTNVKAAILVELGKYGE